MYPLCLYDAPTSGLSHTRLGTGHSSDPPGLPQALTRHNYPSPLPQASGKEGARPLHPAPPPPGAPYLFVPDLQRLAADAVEDGEEAALERVFEHLAGGLLFGCAAAT